MPKQSKGKVNRYESFKKDAPVTNTIESSTLPGHERLSLIVGPHAENDAKNLRIFEAEVESKLSMAYPNSVYIIQEWASPTDEINTGILTDISNQRSVLESVVRNRFRSHEGHYPNPSVYNQYRNFIQNRDPYAFAQLSILEKYSTSPKYKGKVKVQMEAGNTNYEQQHKVIETSNVQRIGAYVSMKNFDTAAEYARQYTQQTAQVQRERHKIIVSQTQELLNKPDCGAVIITMGSNHDTLAEDFADNDMPLTYDHVDRTVDYADKSADIILMDRLATSKLMSSYIRNHDYKPTQLELYRNLADILLVHEYAARPALAGVAKFNSTREWYEACAATLDKLQTIEKNKDFHSLIGNFGLAKAIQVINNE